MMFGKLECRLIYTLMSKMIPVFDLDDTLYPERSFVESGFKAVADWLMRRLGWEAGESLCTMLSLLEIQGRGAVFDGLLASKGVRSVGLVNECVKIYRQHMPNITLDPVAKIILTNLNRSSYLVTDGHKIVQRNKISALGVDAYLKKSFITHCYGVRHAKPSVYCFDIIRKREMCEWSDMIYVGDNPTKDFVNLNLLGVRTVRVLSGEHKKVKAEPGFEAAHVISNIGEIVPLLEEWCPWMCRK